MKIHKFQNDLYLALIERLKSSSIHKIPPNYLLISKNQKEKYHSIIYSYDEINDSPYFIISTYYDWFPHSLTIKISHYQLLNDLIRGTLLYDQTHNFYYAIKSNQKDTLTEIFTNSIFHLNKQNKTDVVEIFENVISKKTKSVYAKSNFINFVFENKKPNFELTKSTTGKIYSLLNFY
jgi:hypothetical protein